MHHNPLLSFDVRKIGIAEVRRLCEQFHGYGSAGASSTYAFGVYEDDKIVAAYTWQPPPPGAATSVCPEAPYGVLSLSRMVAVPRDSRRLNHVSRPLRHQMHKLLDRTRWPVLVTYSDEGQGHTGHVYKCSGWTPTRKATAPYYTDGSGHRVSSYSNGLHGFRGFTKAGTTTIQRWEQWICPVGQAAEWMSSHGWHKIAIPGKVWASGNQAYTYVRKQE